MSQKKFILENTKNLPSNLWVINASYYSMFFAATALLARYNKGKDLHIILAKLLKEKKPKLHLREQRGL